MNTPHIVMLSLNDLRPLVFRDHALELHQQLILRCRCLWRLHEDCVNAVANRNAVQTNPATSLDVSTLAV